MNLFIKSIFFTIVFSIAFFLVFNFVFSVRGDGIYETDIPSHIDSVKYYYEKGESRVPHKGFIYAVLLFKLLFRLNFEYATILLLSISILLIAFTINQILSWFLKEFYTTPFILFVTGCLMLFSAIFVPFFNYIYLGQGSPNVWHNPTLFLVKPFAFISFFLFVYFLETKETQKSNSFILLLALLLLISVLMKPNFVIAFIPSVAIYILIKHAKKIKLYWKSTLIFLPSVILLLMQFTDYSKLELRTSFGFFVVWMYYSPNVPFSLLLALAFPLSVLFFRFKSFLNNNYLILSWIFIIISILQFGLLVEIHKASGGINYDGNWGWGYLIALHNLFIYNSIEFFRWLKLVNMESKFERIKVTFTSILFSLHLSSGIYYFVKIITGGSFA